MTRYPFGLHGYHRPGSNGKVKWYDPTNAFGADPDPQREAGEAAQREEARKQAIRDQINVMYGIRPDGTATGSTPKARNGTLLGASYTAPGDSAAASLADAAKAELDKEGSDVGDATKSYYTDQLNRGYTAAERNTRFNLARQGLLGGSVDADQQGQVRSDRDLGGTRIAEAVRQAVTGLQAQREGERLGAVSLVNAGQGDEGVRAATTGLQASLDNVKNANKADIFGGLFAGSADAFANQNFNAANAAALARYQNQLGAFFPATSTGSGRVTST